MNTFCLVCIACQARAGLGIPGYGFGPAGSLTNKSAEEIPPEDPLHDIIQVMYVQKYLHLFIDLRDSVTIF